MTGRRVFLDIETLPDRSSQSFFGRSVEDLEPFEAGQEFLATSLGTLTCHVCAYAVAVDGGPVRSSIVDPDQEPGAAERALLDALREDLQRAGITRRGDGCLVGHNLAGFDLPILYHRAVAYGHPLRFWLPWTHPGVKPWHLSERLHDTLTIAKGPGWGGGKGLGLKSLAAFYGVPMADDPGPGSEVYTWWIEGRTEQIREHVQADVEDLRHVYARLVPAWPFDWTGEGWMPRPQR